MSSAVVDLDLVYEMLDPLGRSGKPKDVQQLWVQSRWLAGRITAALLETGICVVVEGNFATDAALAEFESELPRGTAVCLVMLGADIETALERASSDSSRGLSRERSFLSEHYQTFRPEWSGRDVLRIDTTRSAPSDEAQLVVRSLMSKR